MNYITLQNYLSVKNKVLAVYARQFMQLKEIQTTTACLKVALHKNCILRNNFKCLDLYLR